jgi:hypothetical protein
MRYLRTTAAKLVALWLLAFIGLTVATYDAGNSGEKGWSMNWGYPMWISFQSSPMEQFPSELAKGQLVLLQGFSPKNGAWHLDIMAFLLALAVPFSPIAICIAGYRFAQNRFRYYLSTLLVFVLACAVLLGVNVPRISATAWAWPSDFWHRVMNCCILVWPSISATITLCFLFSVGHEWWRRRIDAKAKTKKPQVDGDKT